MRQATGRILYRIIFPFAALFSVATALYWLLSAYLISHHLDQHSRLQMEHVAQMALNSGFVLNPEVLGHLKQVINAELLVYDERGEILSGTFSPAVDPSLLRQFLPEGPLEKGNFHFKDLLEAEKRYRVILYPFRLEQGDPVVLSVWFPTAESEALKGRIIGGVGILALASLAAMVCIGYRIARTITAPIEELVRATEEVSNGQRRRVRNLGSDEVGVLAESFNRMVEQLLGYEQRLVESERLATAGRMAAGLAHEVRNPLTSIKMLAQVLHGRLAGLEENQKVILSLVGEIDRLDRIVQGMIDRTRAGEIQRAPVDVNGLIDEVLSLMGASLQAQGIDTEYRPDPSIPAAMLDGQRFKQVLWNLLLNGKEAMPLGGRLSITTGVDTGGILICIEDSGPGISQEEREKLFQPLQTSKPEGMGLGLFISRQIVEKHGGTLDVGSRPEGGARAVVIVPVSVPVRRDEP